MNWFKSVFFAGTVVLCLAIISSCGSSEEESVNFDDIAPTSEKYQNEAKKDFDKELVKSEKPAVSEFLTLGDSLFPDATWKNWDTLLFLDRFGAIASEKWILTNDKDSVVFLSYSFKDSLRVKNAFYNWLDCFGAPCKSYKVGQNAKYNKRNTLVYVAPQQVVLVESSGKLKEENIRFILQKEKKKQFWIYILDAPKKGKTVWKRIEKGEEKPISKVDENS
jgi:hypothetical protein